MLIINIHIYVHCDLDMAFDKGCFSEIVSEKDLWS